MVNNPFTQSKYTILIAQEILTERINPKYIEYEITKHSSMITRHFYHNMNVRIRQNCAFQVACLTLSSH